MVILVANRTWWPPAPDKGKIAPLPLACEVTGDPGAVILSRGLSKRFGGLKALDGVSSSVHSNDVHALIGPNGSGKTCSTC